MAIDIKQELISAGTKYKKELLAMPVAVLAKILEHFMLMTGIQGKEMGGILTTDAQLRPYRTDKGASDNTKIEPYEWETFLGDVVKEFDPNKLLGTLYTERTSTKPDKTKIARLVALEMAKKVGEALYRSLFVAVRNAAGETTNDLFNGYSTQIKAAIVSEVVSALNGNYLNKSGVQMTVDNCGDILKQLWRGSNELLKDLDTEMKIPTAVLEMYEDWYQIEHGVAPFNKEFSQKTLVGTDGRCTLVPLGNMGGQPFIFLTVKDNMKIGVDQESDSEDVEIRRVDNPKVVQFFMLAYFGVGFETLDARYFKVMKFTTDPIVPVANFANSAKTAVTATFTWTAATEPTSLKIQKSADGGATWADAATAAAIGVGAVTAQVTGLVAETEYDFRLVVVDGQNAGNSNVVNLTTSAA